MADASGDHRPEARLSPPAVDPGVYDEAYYLQHCAGAAEWRESGGRGAGGYYLGCLQRAGFRAGEVLVDVGCGRGELVALALEQGAARAIGVEYSGDAVQLARRTLAARDTGDRAEILHADARALPVPEGLADVVTLLDVVEHLDPEELEAALAEALRVLKPGGRVVIHTLPNRLIYDVTYRLQRLLVPGRSRRWPKDPRMELERLMHVNEQTRRSLLAGLRRAGFARARVDYGLWIHDGFVPDARPRRLYGRLAAHRPTRPLGAADLWGEGLRPA